MQTSPLPPLPYSFRWVARPWGRALECVPLAEVARHGWSTRDLALEGDERQMAAAWEALSGGEHLSPANVVRVRQVHSATVITDREAGAAADAIVSSDGARLLTVRVADCVPLLMADRRTGIVAAVHAGWRGTSGGIAAAAIVRLATEFGSRSADLVAALGPAIQACCYEVGPEVRESFRVAGVAADHLDAWFTPGRTDRLQLDVPRANHDQLIDAGIPASQIYDSALCTACHPSLFHSYRRDKERAGRLVGYIRAGAAEAKQET
jgi:YfiH family protein